MDDPATTYREIRADLVHGNLAPAKQKLDSARPELSALYPAWSTRFLLLDAEVMTYQGHAPGVIAALDCRHPLSILSSDQAIQRSLLCAQAEARLGETKISAVHLSNASSLCQSSQCAQWGQLLRTDASIHTYRSDLIAAATLFHQSLDAARQVNDSFLEASDLLNLGVLSLDKDHYDEALSFFTQSAALADKIQASQISQAALGNSGLAYLHLGDLPRSLSSFQQAEEAAKTIGVTSNEVTWLWDEGVANSKLANLEMAADCYRRALKLANKNGDPEAINGINTALGFLAYDSRQYPDALAYSRDALKAASDSGDLTAEVRPHFLEALLAVNGPDPDRGEAMLLDVHNKAAEDAYTRWAIETALADFYSARHLQIKADLWYRKSIGTFETQRDAVQNEELRLPFFANGEELYRHYAGFLIDNHQTEKALSLLDRARSRTLAEGLGQSPVTYQSRIPDALNAEDTARKLQATILFYALGSEKSYLWVIDSRQAQLFPLPKSAVIEAELKSYRKSLLQSSDPIREGNANAMSLYGLLVAPAASTIGTNSRVFIVADGALNQLNFETLVVPGKDGDKPHYWIEDVTLTNASSIRLLGGSMVSRDRSKSTKLLLVGDPTTNGTGFEALPHAAAEVTTVEKRFAPDDRTVVTQSEAVPSAYADSHPDRFGYIHFVAHGTASLLSPLDSAVILSPTPQHPDGFKLYARDIIRHPITAGLVTISACNGSGLRAYAGEGLIGLSWAFLRAGAHHVIGALWEVDDAATPMLMDHLYAEMRAQKIAPDAALRDAKLALLHSSGVYRKPFYWAAFQLYAGS